MYRYIGVDAAGIVRVYGEATDSHSAASQCWKAIREYVARRPDTAPVSRWIIEEAGSSA